MGLEMIHARNLSELCFTSRDWRAMLMIVNLSGKKRPPAVAKTINYKFFQRKLSHKL